MDDAFNRDQACIFCQIVAGEVDASLVYQDDLISAFMDHYPVTPGHVLVVPNRHAVRITEVDPTTVGRMFEAGAHIDQAIRKSGFRCEAVSLYLADGAAAGQVVSHTHLHVVPRFRGDSCGLRLHAGPVETVARTALDKHAATIKNSLKIET
jgi:diadenosine tetraphosphate (Ap4A) HIT family hydrolase